MKPWEFKPRPWPKKASTLEDRYQVLLTWAEALMAEHRVYLTTPDDLTCKRETSEKVDDPRHLAAELLRCEASELYARVLTESGKRHAPPGVDRCEGEKAA